MLRSVEWPAAGPVFRSYVAGEALVLLVLANLDLLHLAFHVLGLAVPNLEFALAGVRGAAPALKEDVA